MWGHVLRATFVQSRVPARISSPSFTPLIFITPPPPTKNVLRDPGNGFTSLLIVYNSRSKQKGDLQQALPVSPTRVFMTSLVLLLFLTLLLSDETP